MAKTRLTPAERFRAAVAKFRTAADAYLADPQNLDPAAKTKVIGCLRSLGMKAPCVIRYRGCLFSFQDRALLGFGLTGVIMVVSGGIAESFLDVDERE